MLAGTLAPCSGVSAVPLLSSSSFQAQARSSRACTALGLSPPLQTLSVLLDEEWLGWRSSQNRAGLRGAGKAGKMSRRNPAAWLVRGIWTALPAPGYCLLPHTLLQSAPPWNTLAWAVPLQPAV